MRAKTDGASAGARSRAYSQNWTPPVTAKSAAVPSTHAWARPRSGFDSATQMTITRTPTERAPAASMSPRRSWRTKAASSRARAPRSAGVTVAPASTLPGRVGAHGRLVHIRAPAGAPRQDQVAVLDLGRVGDELVVPGHDVGIDLHDAEIRHHRAEVCVHERGQVT